MDPAGHRRSAASRAEAGRPPMDVRVFEGVGHDLMRYRPDEVATELERLAGA